MNVFYVKITIITLFSVSSDGCVEGLTESVDIQAPDFCATLLSAITQFSSQGPLKFHVV